VHPHAADHLLLPYSIIHQLAFTKYLSRDQSRRCVLVNDAVPQNTSVLGEYGEIIALFKFADAFIALVKSIL